MKYFKKKTQDEESLLHNENEVETDQIIEDKLNESVDQLTHKSSKIRTNAFKNLSKILIENYEPDFVKSHIFTMTDAIEKSLKKKSGEAEAILAADLAAHLFTQLSLSEDREEICKKLSPVLWTVLNDKYSETALKTKCCSVLGYINFLTNAEIGDIILLMQQLSSIFVSCAKMDVAAAKSDVAESLCAAALTSWSLLFTLMPTDNISHLIKSKTLTNLEQIFELLEIGSLEVRLAAGEALAIVFEMGRLEDSDFQEELAYIVAETLREFGKECTKHMGKKDKKQQRAEFRDILKLVEDNEVSELSMKFGKEEYVMDTLVKQKMYGELCKVLGPGITSHLAVNELIREVLEIADVAKEEIVSEEQQLIEKLDRKYKNAASFKARTKSRASDRKNKMSEF